MVPPLSRPPAPFEAYARGAPADLAERHEGRVLSPSGSVKSRPPERRERGGERAAPPRHAGSAAETEELWEWDHGRQATASELLLAGFTDEEEDEEDAALFAL